MVVIGAAHRPGGVPRGKTNVKGFIRGFDVRTGKRLWIFHTIPRLGEFGNDTWEKDSWRYTGNAGVWGQMAIDEELNMAYLPVELPTGDYYGGNRPAHNLFSETLVAVDLKTGQRKWHYQFVHHGIWDFDMAAPPILADITVNGRAIKAIAQPTKQSWLYVFDRTNGQPVWPIVERPVPKGDVPGRVVLADAAVPDQAAGLRSAGHVDRRSDRLHAGAARRSGEARVEIQDRSDLHAAGGQQGRRSARHVDAAVGRRRRQLGGRLVRSRNAHGLRVFADHADVARSRAGARRQRLRLGLGQRGDRWPRRRRAAARAGAAGAGRGAAAGAGAAPAQRPVGPRRRQRRRPARAAVAAAV